LEKRKGKVWQTIVVDCYNKARNIENLDWCKTAFIEEDFYD